MPYFSTERARRVDQRTAPERPVVLTRPHGAAVVVEHVCPAGRRLGLRAGWSLGQAQALAPQLVALDHDPVRDRTVLQRLARWAVRFSPVVEVVEPDTLLLDITGCQRLFGGEAPIARQALEGLARRGFSARGVVADTVGAASALAVAGSERLCIVPVGQAVAWLAPLPPAALRLEADVAERLDALGVRTIGDLLSLPRSTLPARFGTGLVRRLQQALGEVYEGVTSTPVEEVPFARWSFETPVADALTVQAAAADLLDEVGGQVRARVAALRRLDCVVYFEEVPPQVAVVHLARASRQWVHVGTLLLQRLERVDVSPGVTGLMLVARETSRHRGRQGELFTPHVPEDDEELGVLIDRLAGGLGHEAVVRPRLVDDYQPERAFRYVPVAETGCEAEERDGDHGEKGTVGAEGAQGLGASPARPVRVFGRPLRVRVIALVPDGPPTWFAWNGREYRVVAARGPERIETAWWRGPDVLRDYFEVTAEDGGRYWLFCTRDRGEWYLHGVFV